MQEGLLEGLALLECVRQHLLNEAGDFFTLVPVTITDTKHVCVGTFSEIGMKYESVLVLLARIARHVSNSRSEGVLCDHVVPDLLLLIA